MVMTVSKHAILISDKASSWTELKFTRNLIQLHNSSHPKMYFRKTNNTTFDTLETKRNKNVPF